MFHNTEAEEVASLMNISERSVYRYAERFLATSEVRPLFVDYYQIFSLQVMREGGFSTPLCHYAIILRPKNET